jgi:hypothetical protein
MKGVRGGSAMLPLREAKVPHYAPDVAELPRSREGRRQRSGGCGPGGTKASVPALAYFAALATFTPLELDA